MADPVAASIGHLVPVGDLMTGYPFQDLPEGVVNASTPNAGMVPSVARDKQPQNAVLEAKNTRLTTRGIRRRDGTSLHSTKPNSNAVTGLVTFIDEQSVVRLVRVTADSLHVWTGGGWKAYTYAPEGSGIETRPTFTLFLDRAYIGGVGRIVQVDFGAHTAEEIENAPRSRYVTTFAERLIGAHNSGDSFNIEWSANGDPTDWESESAGEENLVQSPSNFGDDITGIFGLEEEMLILRRQSIWIARRQPFAIAPFSFKPLVTNVGCDMPHTAVAVPGGVIFADRRTNSVYVWQSGNRPQKISSPIERELFSALGSAKWSQATYDATSQRYVLGLVTTSGSKVMTKFWSFSLLHGGWTYDEGPNARSLSVFALSDPTMIDDLPGLIDDLEGSIDDLSAESILTMSHLIGREDGEIFIEDPDEDTDADGTAFETVIESLNLGSVTNRRTMQEFMLTVVANRSGSVSLSQSKDRNIWSSVKTRTLTANGRREKTALKNNPITGDDLFFRLFASSSDVEIQSYWARLMEKGYKHG